MKTSWRVRSFAKLNLGLAAGPRRKDGRHALVTLYQSIDLADTLEFRFGGRGFRLACDDPSIPAGGENLVWRALEALRPFMRKNQGVAVRLRKRIPAGAGLGGGSSNAAATLLAVNRALGLGLSAGALHALAARLGSDVPFFLCGGAALGVGRGEVVCPLPDLFRGTFYALVAPDASLSTAAVYRAFDAGAPMGGRMADGGLEKSKIQNPKSKMERPRRAGSRAFMTSAMERLLRETMEAVRGGGAGALSLRNDLAPPAERLLPLLRRLRASRAWGLPRRGRRGRGGRPAMTGSGSALYALYRSRREAEAAARRLRLERGVRLARAGRLLPRPRVLLT